MNSEKVSVNINNDKLAKIDMLVTEGFYSNRSAFINDAVNTLLQQNEGLIETIVSESNKPLSTGMWFIGTRNLTKDLLEEYLQHETTFSIRGFGILYIDNEVTSDLLSRTVTHISGKINIKGNAEVLRYAETIRK